MLSRAAGKLVRAARRVQAAGGATGTVMTDRRRAAARRVREIASKLHARGKLSREETTQAIARVTGELAGLAEKTAAEAAAVLRNGRRGVKKALSGRVRGRLVRALGEPAVTIERTATIVTQTRSRLAGRLPDSATRLVSLHDPDAPPIRKGRIDRPAEFGPKSAGSPTTPTGSYWSTASSTAPHRTARSWPPRYSASTAAPARYRARSPPTAATPRPPPMRTCRRSAPALSQSPPR